MTIGFVTEVLGTATNNQITGSDLQIIYGLAGEDTLSSALGSLSEGSDSTGLVGGSGGDTYIVANNSSIAILDSGTSSDDVLKTSGIGVNRNTSFVAEIDSRHLYVGDILSNQYVFLIDWQQPQNRIETVELLDVNLTYDVIASSFRQLSGYQGNFSWAELEALEEINLERIGLSPSSVNDAISQVMSRAIELESSGSIPIVPPDNRGNNGGGDNPDTPNNGNNDTDNHENGGDNGGIDPLLNRPFNRFRNKFVSGTYLFANETESQSIIDNFSDTFELEGTAFNVSSEPADGLVKFNRFANTQVTGTYLFATEDESVSIRENFSDVFQEEGIAFYAYGADANHQGTDYYRLANTQVSGTYLFVNEAEKNSALDQFPNLFRNEGIAFNVR